MTLSGGQPPDTTRNDGLHSKESRARISQLRGSSGKRPPQDTTGLRVTSTNVPDGHEPVCGRPEARVPQRDSSRPKSSSRATQSEGGTTGHGRVQNRMPRKAQGGHEQKTRGRTRQPAQENSIRAILVQGNRWGTRKTCPTIRLRRRPERHAQQNSPQEAGKGTRRKGSRKTRPRGTRRRRGRSRVAMFQ